MKKIIIFLFFILFSCENYKSNIEINKRKPPVIVIAIDTVKFSVLMRDGDNMVFTIYDNPTTTAITRSLIVGDTIRINPVHSLEQNF